MDKKIVKLIETTFNISETSTSGPNKPRNPRPKKEEPSKEAIEAKLKLLRQEKQLVKEEKKLVDQLEKAKSLENKKPVRQPRPNNNAAKNTTTGNKPNVKKEINVQIRKVETVKVQKKTTQK